MSASTPAPTTPLLDDWTPPEGWPKMDHATIRTMLTAPGAPFEMETVDIRGVPTRTWKNAPPTIRDILAIGRTHGDREFLVLNDERVTYNAFHRAVAQLAAHLLETGIQKGDRVALAMRNLPEWPVAFFAIAAIGAICVPLNAWWTGPELEFGLANGSVFKDGSIVIVGHGGSVLRSIDKGRSFSVLNRPDRLSLAGVAMDNNGRLILVGQGGVHVSAPTDASLGQQ